MELNPYDPPRPALEAPTGANPPDEPRYKQVLRRAVLITAYFSSWLRWFDRLCGFGTILIFLIGFAIAVALNR